MGTFNLGPCECCGEAPVFETCADCVADIIGVTVTVEDMTDCFVGSSHTTNFYGSNLNGTYAFTNLIASTSSSKAFELELGTENDCGDRGIMYGTFLRPGDFPPHIDCERYVYRLTCRIDCNFVIPTPQRLSFQFASDSHAFVVEGGCSPTTNPSGVNIWSIVPEKADLHFDEVCNEGAVAEFNDTVCGNPYKITFEKIIAP
jgi:hypothetical protein